MIRLLTLLLIAMAAATVRAEVKSWGDQGNGTYINPVLNADYSDPDIIRVGDRYYMVCSDFHFMGMPVLESTDLLNWRIISHIYDRFDYPGWDTFSHYAGGSWAPALRYHDGRYYVYFCTPDEGLFMTTATNPAGPWEPLHLVKAVEKWEDPCPFWDEDGQAYLMRSRHRAGPIIVHRMSADGRQLLDEGITVYKGSVAEGPKVHKFDGKYYILIPEGGVSRGWQTVLRSDSIYGPYERKVVLERGSTDINGPHQGALVDSPDGSEWWFLHFQSTPERGRVLHLQPVTWHEGWPMPGVDIDRNGVGEPVRVWTAPAMAKGSKPSFPATSDDFSAPQLGLQWQANHRFYRNCLDLDSRKGWLTMQALHGDSLRNSPNTLVQKMMGYRGTFTALADTRGMKPGQRAGVTCMAKELRGAGVADVGGKLYLYTENGPEVTISDVAVAPGNLWLRAELDATANRHRLLYSTDGENFVPFGEEFEMVQGHWKGPHVGIYTYTTGDEGGKVAWDEVRYEYD